MTYFKQSKIKMEKNNQTSTTIDTTNIKTIDMTAKYGIDENSKPPFNKEFIKKRNRK